MSNPDYDARSLQEAIQRLSGTFGVTFVKMFDATVKTVDLKSRKCTVDSIDSKLNIQGLQVRLLAEVSDGDLNVPDLEETVIVAFSDFLEPFIVNYSWISEKIIIVGNQGWDIQKDKQILNDGKYGGLAVVKESGEVAGLLKKINALENKINDINKRLNGFINTHKAPTWVPVPNDGGAALQTAISAWLVTPDGLPVSNINPLTTEEDISNPSITHGDKLPD